MFGNNENTLAYFQADKPKKLYKTNNVRHIESEIKQYGFAYCYNQTLVEELKMKGYIADGDMVRKDGSL